MAPRAKAKVMTLGNPHVGNFTQNRLLQLLTPICQILSGRGRVVDADVDMDVGMSVTCASGVGTELERGPTRATHDIRRSLDTRRCGRAGGDWLRVIRG